MLIEPGSIYDSPLTVLSRQLAITETEIPSAKLLDGILKAMARLSQNQMQVFPVLALARCPKCKHITNIKSTSVEDFGTCDAILGPIGQKVGNNFGCVFYSPKDKDSSMSFKPKQDPATHQDELEYIAQELRKEIDIALESPTIAFKGSFINSMLATLANLMREDTTDIDFDISFDHELTFFNPKLKD